MDVKAERETLKNVVDEINYDIGSNLDLMLKIKTWDYVDANAIEQSIGSTIKENDIFVGIFHQRFTPSLEEEFRAAFTSFRKFGAPQIMLYFCNAPVPLSDNENLDQIRRVIEFKDELKATGYYWREYTDSGEFSSVARHDLTRFLATFKADDKEVFISYASQDSDRVRIIADVFITEGINTWYDTSKLTGGDDWVKRIAEAIEAADTLVLIASQAAVDSKWVRRELDFADQREKQIIPVVFDDVKWPSWFDLQFGRLQRLQFKDIETKDAALRILEAVRDSS
jgi:hypothetical protein